MLPGARMPPSSRAHGTAGVQLTSAYVKDDLLSEIRRPIGRGIPLKRYKDQEKLSIVVILTLAAS